jgi:hypothetical protein
MEKVKGRGVIHTPLEMSLLQDEPEIESIGW